MKKMMIIISSFLLFAVVLSGCSNSASKTEEITLGFNGSKIPASQIEQLKSSGVEVVEKDIAGSSEKAELYKLKSGKYTVFISSDSKNNMLNLEIYSNADDYVQEKKPLSSVHKNKTDDKFDIEIKDGNYIYLSSNSIVKLKKS